MSTLHPHHNNVENEVPTASFASRKTLKVSMDSKGEKRMRSSKMQNGTVRRAALGDVTNKISIKKTSTMAMQQKKKMVRRAASTMTSSVSALHESHSHATHNSSFVTKPSSSMPMPKPMPSSLSMVHRSVPSMPVPAAKKVSSLEGLERHELEEKKSKLNKEHSLHHNSKPQYQSKQPEEAESVKSDPLQTLEEKEAKEKERTDKLASNRLSSDLDFMTINEEELRDIDSADRHDPTSCWQYAADITEYQLSTEKQRMVKPYMANQSDINSKMRAILIDWLVDVHCKYDLVPQTLHIAIHLIDRHLERDLNVPRQRLQLVGVTALFIASKYEEIYPPEANDFVRITDNAYTKEEVFEMEADMLAMLGYRVTFPTAYQFLKRFLKASRTCDDRVDHFAHYVIDRSLQEYKMIKYLPSMIAASAVHIARTQMHDFPAWNMTIEHHSSYSEVQLSDCIADLEEMLWNAQNGVGKTHKLTAVRRKFEKEKYMGVSSYPLVFEPSN